MGILKGLYLVISLKKDMINKLQLKAFQAHKLSNLEFDPGVNAIIGESDEGKTSIIRALYWAAQNKPSGDDFISNFSKRGECSATVEIDRQTVTRFKNKTKNEYRINDQEFKALGKSGVPDEVSNILQLDDLNFQNQMDAPFLLSNNGGEVARYLNDIVNLNVIDVSLTKIKSKVNGTARDIEENAKEAGLLKTELSELDWILEAEKEILKLEDDYHEHKNKSEVNEMLADLLDDIDDLSEELAKHKDRDQELYDICLLIDEAKAYLSSAEQLDSFKNDLNGVKTISSKLDSLPFDKKEIYDLIALNDSINDFQVKEKALGDLNELIESYYGLDDEISILSEAIQAKEDDFSKSFPDVCPLCGDIK